MCNVQRATRDATRGKCKSWHTRNIIIIVSLRVCVCECECVACVRVCAAPIMAAILLLPLAAFTLNEIPF